MILERKTKEEVCETIKPLLDERCVFQITFNEKKGIFNIIIQDGTGNVRELAEQIEKQKNEIKRLNEDYDREKSLYEMEMRTNNGLREQLSKYSKKEGKE